jgi:uncharacterized protein (DUF983 family)
MKISRGEIAQRCLLLRCPNCGEGGQLRSWFRMQPACPHCQMAYAQEDGFTMGTTSIGYVAAIVLVVVPTCILVVMNLLAVWVGVAIGIAGSIGLSIGLYPVFLGWVLMTYYVSHAEHLPANQEPVKPTPSP